MKKALVAMLMTAMLLAACGLRIEIRTDECTNQGPKEAP